METQITRITEQHQLILIGILTNGASLAIDTLPTTRQYGLGEVFRIIHATWVN